MKTARLKKIVSSLLVLMMLTSTFSSVAWASEVECGGDGSFIEDNIDDEGSANGDAEVSVNVIDSGTFGADGNNLNWKLDNRGVLTISGTGAMNAFETMSDVPWYDGHSAEITEVNIEEGVTNIGSRTFQNYPALKKVTLPQTVRSIDYWGFYKTSALTEINLQNVEEIGECAFCECTGLASVDLSGAINIGRGAFLRCSGLTNIVVGGENESIVGKQAFSSCTNLTTVTFGNVSSIGENAFELAGITSIDLSSVKTIEKNAFLNASALASVTFGENLTSIGNTAFKATGLTEVTVPSSVTKIGNQAFMNCTRMKKAEIKANITVLSAGLFNGCTALAEITLPSGLTEIKAAVFTNCENLVEITLPGTLVAIGNNGFKGCTGLTTVYFDGMRTMWETVTVGATGNDPLSNAKIICKDDDSKIEVSGISLDKVELKLQEDDDAVELIATIEPENATEKKVIWNSSDENVAIVEEGKVKAVAPGTATITASVGKCTATCTVTVCEKESGDSVELNKFQFVASSQNKFTNGTVSASLVKQEDGTYWLSVPLCSVYTIGKSISIVAPDDFTEEFKVEYKAYENNEWTSTPALKTVTSQNGMVILEDHFVYGQPKVYCSDLTLDIGEEKYVIKLKPYAEIGTITVQNVGNYQYPVTKNETGGYSTSVKRGDTVTIVISSGISGGNLTYSFFIDDEQTNSIQYTPADEPEKTFKIRSAPRKDNMGFDEISFTLDISVVEETNVPRLLNYNNSSQSYDVITSQGMDCSLALQTENTNDNTVYTWKISQVAVEGGNGSTILVDTSVPEKKSYTCTITNIVDGIEYTITTGTIQVWVTPKNSIESPTIISQPESAEYAAGAEAEQLSVEISDNIKIGNGYAFVYQWFKTTDPEDDSKTQPISEINRLYSGISCFMPSTASVGSIWYFCEISLEYTCLSEDGTYTTYKSESVRSDFAEIKVNGPTIELEGKGTEDDPLLIKNYDDLMKVRDSVAEGTLYEGMHFRLLNDIALGEDWTPIGCTVDGTNKVSTEGNLRAFCGTLDGNGKTVTVYQGGLPLFNYVNGATIKNLNIYGTQINGYGLINEMHGVGLSGTSVVIDNVKILSGTNILKSGLLGGEIDGNVNGFAGVSAGYEAKISNCTIESGVTIGYDGSQTYIGSFAGRFQGTIENCVSYATVKGVGYVGGIIGTRDNAMGLCSVSGCSFHGSVVASGNQAGGIVGGGYSNSTAPNGIKITVKDCTVTGSVTGADKVGGILGGDSFVAQAWNAYSFTGNTFTGTVSGTGSYVGAIIGYYDSLNRIDDISGNTYTANCGTSKGIGFVKYLDTNYQDPAAMEGTVVFSTEGGTSGCPSVTGCWWKADHNRTDDPLGKDAASLCKLERSLGDVNGDGEITNADVAALLTIVTEGENDELSVADINGDGLITNADVAQLLQMVTAA